MTNKLVVIINSFKVPKIKKILLYEMKFLVPNYRCLQNPRLGGYRPQIPVLCVLCPQLNLLNPPPRTKFLGTPLLRAARTRDVHRQIRRLWKLRNRRRQTRERIEGRRLTQGLTLQADLSTYVHIHTGFKPYLYWCDCYQVLEDESSPFVQKIHDAAVAAVAAVGSACFAVGPYNNPPNRELC